MKITALSKALGFSAFMALTASVVHSSESDTVRVLVKYRKPVAMMSTQSVAAARAEVLSSVNAQVKVQLPKLDVVAVVIAKDMLPALKANPNVEYVEPDLLRYQDSLVSKSTGTPYNVGQMVPYGVRYVQAHLLPQLDANAGNRKLCIVDSGIDATHADLAGNHLTGEVAEAVDAPADLLTWDVDFNHHGTHVAGTIAALNNSTGVVGVNPGGNLNLHIVKVFGASGSASSSTIMDGVSKCVTAGANVISMSLGGSDFSQTESDFYQSIADAGGILVVAAAGNTGLNEQHYPASYPSNMSVAAIDVNRVKASFSTFNDQVDIAAPGVSVLSSITTDTGRTVNLNIGGTGMAGSPMSGTPGTALGSLKGELYNMGLALTTDAGAAGKVCLIQRGSAAFSTKVLNCQNSGGIAAIISNNVSGMLNGTLSTTVTTIPSIGISMEDGAVAIAAVGAGKTYSRGNVSTDSYAYYNGTSMATPHVSGVAALVWSYFPSCTAAQIRNALEVTAKDLDVAGRDDNTGHGLVQALNAYAYLGHHSCI